jgi:hypothetical protein
MPQSRPAPLSQVDAEKTFYEDLAALSLAAENAGCEPAFDRMFVTLKVLILADRNPFRQGKRDAVRRFSDDRGDNA